jgi:hypothetical protein
MQNVFGFFRDTEWLCDPVSHHPDNLRSRTDQRPMLACPPGDFEINIEIVYFDRLPAHAQRSDDIPGLARADDQTVSRQPVRIQPGRPVISAQPPAFSSRV